MEKANEGKYLKNLKKGMKVAILTRENKSVSGIIEDIGSRKDFHDEGIMVMLTTGEVGRVKHIHNYTKVSETESFIKKGERYTVEFKASALWSVHMSDQEIRESKSFELNTYRKKASKVIIAKSIAALLNSSGGILFIGVKEEKNSKEVVVFSGIEDDLQKLTNDEKDATLDGYKRMLLDDIVRPFFPPTIYNHLNLYVTIDFEKIHGKTICIIKVNKSDIMVFLQLLGKKVFMIRIDTESRQIQDEELVDYCMKRFGR